MSATQRWPLNPPDAFTATAIQSGHSSRHTASRSRWIGGLLTSVAPSFSHRRGPSSISDLWRILHQYRARLTTRPPLREADGRGRLSAQETGRDKGGGECHEPRCHHADGPSAETACRGCRPSVETRGRRPYRRAVTGIRRSRYLPPALFFPSGWGEWLAAEPPDEGADGVPAPPVPRNTMSVYQRASG